MTRYTVNATLTAPAWIVVEADDEAEALELADEAAASSYEFDLYSAEIEFNVSPRVEAES